MKKCTKEALVKDIKALERINKKLKKDLRTTILKLKDLAEENAQMTELLIAWENGEVPERIVQTDEYNALKSGNLEFRVSKTASSTELEDLTDIANKISKWIKKTGINLDEGSSEDN